MKTMKLSAPEGGPSGLSRAFRERRPKIDGSLVAVDTVGEGVSDADRHRVRLGGLDRQAALEGLCGGHAERVAVKNILKDLAVNPAEARDKG